MPPSLLCAVIKSSWPDPLFTFNLTQFYFSVLYLGVDAQLYYFVDARAYICKLCHLWNWQWTEQTHKHPISSDCLQTTEELVSRHPPSTPSRSPVFNLNSDTESDKCSLVFWWNAVLTVLRLCLCPVTWHTFSHLFSENLKIESGPVIYRSIGPSQQKSEHW